MEDFKYLFTSGYYATKRGKGLSAIPPASWPSQAQCWPPALSCPSPSALWPTCQYLVSFLGVSLYLKTTDPRVSKAMEVLHGKELKNLGTVDNKVFQVED